MATAAASPQEGEKPRPAVELLGASAPEGLKLAQQGSKLSREFRIQSTTAAPVEALRVVVSPLRDANGNGWSTSWEPTTPVTIAAFESVPLTVTADLPANGTYTGEILLLYANTQSRTRFTVTRGPTPLPVEVLGLHPVMTTANVFIDSTATIHFSLRETSGKDLLLESLSVVGLTQVGRDAVQFQARSQVREPKPRKLRGGLPHSEELVLEGLPGAGEYKGTLLLSAAGAQPVERELRLFLKEPWYAALFWIVLGVVASLLLRWATQRLRPRLEKQQAALLLRHELEQETLAQQPPLDGLERQLLARSLTEAERLAAQLEFDATSEADAQSGLARLQHKRALFPVWLAVRRQVLAMRPTELRQPFLERLSVAEAALTRASTTSEELSRIESDLAKAPGEIAQAVRDRLKQALTELATQVDSYREDPSSSLGQSMAVEVAPKLAEAQRHLEDPTRSEPQRVDNAFSAYESARRAYVQLLAESLSVQVSGAQPPYGFEQAPWDELRGKVQAMLEQARERTTDLDAAFEAYTRAHRWFLQGIAHALLEALPKLKREVDEKQKLSDEDKESRKQALDSQAPKLQAVLQKIRQGDLRSAASEYEEILSVVRNAIPVSKTRGYAESLSLAAASLAALGASVTRVQGPPSLAPSPPVPSLQSVTRQRFWSNLAISAFLALVAGLLGMSTLWANDATWGGAIAYVTAFLWGLGLHQASFTTLSALADRMLGKKEAS